MSRGSLQPVQASDAQPALWDRHDAPTRPQGPDKRPAVAPKPAAPKSGEWPTSVVCKLSVAGISTPLVKLHAVSKTGLLIPSLNTHLLANGTQYPIQAVALPINDEPLMASYLALEKMFVFEGGAYTAKEAAQHLLDQHGICSRSANGQKVPAGLEPRPMAEPAMRKLFKRWAYETDKALVVIGGKFRIARDEQEGWDYCDSLTKRATAMRQPLRGLWSKAEGGRAYVAKSPAKRLVHGLGVLDDHQVVIAAEIIKLLRSSGKGRTTGAMLCKNLRAKGITWNTWNDQPYSQFDPAITGPQFREIVNTLRSAGYGIGAEPNAELGYFEFETEQQLIMWLVRQLRADEVDNRAGTLQATLRRCFAKTPDEKAALAEWQRANFLTPLVAPEIKREEARKYQAKLRKALAREQAVKDARRLWEKYGPQVEAMNQRVKANGGAATMADAQLDAEVLAAAKSFEAEVRAAKSFADSEGRIEAVGDYSWAPDKVQLKMDIEAAEHEIKDAFRG